MKIESEKLLEKKLSLKIQDIGGICLKLPAIHVSGIPDRLCLLPRGRVFFAEIKTTKQKVRKLQALWHKKLRDLGFDVYVIDTSEQIESAIDEQIDKLIGKYK